MRKVLAAQHTASGKNNHFHGDNLDFAGYIEKTKQLINETRVDLSNGNAEKIINANAPFAWPSPTNSRKGVLMIHGLLDSPFALHDMARFFNQQGLAVRSILLPGHGTRPGDLLDTNYQAWIKATHFGIESWLNEIDDLTVFGYSGGATLALLAVAQYPQIKRLVLISPSIELRQRRARLANWYQAFGKLRRGLAWYRLSPEPDYSKYTSIPYSLAYQAYQLTTALKKQAHTVDVPIFMALSAHDETVCPEAAIRYFKHQPHPLNQCVLYEAHPSYPDDPQIISRNSHFPADKILNLSHVSLHVAPDNPHYGQNGDYLAELTPSHSKTPPDHTNTYHGAVIADNLADYHIHRLTYNPDFSGLCSQLQTFLNSVNAI